MSDERVVGILPQHLNTTRTVPRSGSSHGVYDTYIYNYNGSA